EKAITCRNHWFTTPTGVTLQNNISYCLQMPFGHCLPSKGDIMFRIITTALLFSLSTAAMAAGWTVERVRGEASINAGNGWQQIQVGLEIGDGARVQTGGSGRVDVVRGNDHFTLGANTVVQIRDAGAELMTSIVQSAGVVDVDVERRNVQHF